MLNGKDSRWWKNDIIWLSKWYTKPTSGDIFTYMYDFNYSVKIYTYSKKL